MSEPKKLLSLYEYNNAALKLHSTQGVLNGIECPTCQTEKRDYSDIILTSYPPQINIHCECGFKGTRIC